MKLRTATIADIPPLCQLLGILFSQEEEFAPNPPLQAEGLRRILTDSKIGDICVAEEAGNIIATVSLLYTVSTALGSQVALLEDMVVEPAHRASGIGGKLLEYALNIAHARGCARITLLTDASNTPAHRFYAHYGFTKSTMVPMRRQLATRRDALVQTDHDIGTHKAI